MKMWNCEMDDPRITDMDPVRKLWMYENWLGDHRDEAELAKNHAYLLGSFWNPEAVQQMLNDVVHESTDEDLEESMKMVMDTDVRASTQKPIKRRRRTALKEQQG
jgi:lipoprotein NlpI